MSEKFQPDPEDLKRDKVNPERKALGKKEYERRLNELVYAAVLLHTESVSYRAFRVGSSVLAEDPASETGYQIKAEHNFKPWEHEQHGWDKLCAEPNACSDVIVKAKGDTYIPAIVVASHHTVIGNKPEDFTKGEKALHSCRNCRNLFRELINEGIMSDETIIRFVDDGQLIEEDEENKDPFIVDTENDYAIIEHPRIKLKEGVKQSDVANLPFEEMTMKVFLDLYNDDPPSQPSKTVAPYKLFKNK